MPDQRPSEKSLFLEACEMTSAAERAAYLDQACEGSPQLRAEVEALLRAHEAPQRVLDAPEAVTPTNAEAPALERPGTVVGPYKLLQQIGEGGMGTVFMAEQTRPVQRKVALKVIKPGMDSRQVIARFEAERQALSMMDHVNIARVFDAGATESGRPYFVMELIHGVPITKYCDDNHLTPRERLELFVPVCQAIQHAHQKGIIHRDIKPSNVMVTLYDGKPVPKVIDFGVAKATEQKLTERTLFTQYGAMVGTLEYMSPEQAEMSALGVDTRSDIFSLGVLLYELLTGSTPLSHKRLKEAAYGEVLRMIREEEAPKPSTRLSESGAALVSISAHRHMEPAKLTTLVRGELDWIVMKTLEKDRNRRYETAKDFAADVQRYLADEPVQACPPSAWYRFRKFARRHKGPVLAASLVVLALVAGVIGTTWGLIREEQQRLLVEGQRNELAERNQALQTAHERERLLNERARQAIETVTSETAIDQLTREKELRPEQKDFLDKMIQYYAESILEGAVTEQERSRQARAYFRMGRLNQILGRSQDGENAYRRAVALGQQLAADFPTLPEYRQELALSHNSLGALLGSTDRLTEAESAFADALAILKQLADQFPDRPEFHRALAGVHNNVGGLLHATGRLTEAEAAHAEALAIRRRLVADFPKQPEFLRPLAMSHSNFGWIFQDTKRPEKAEAAYRDAVAVQKQVVAHFPNRPEFRQDLAKYQFNLGNLLRASGRLKEAEVVYGEALPIRKQLAADFPNRPAFRQELANGHSNVGVLLRDKGLLEDAKAAHTEALAIQKQLAVEFPNRPEFRQELADGHNNLGDLLSEIGRVKEAEAAYAEALNIRKRLAAEFPKVPGYHNGAAAILFSLGKVARLRRDFAAARKLLDEAIPYHRAALRAKPRDPEYRLLYRYSLVELTQSYAGLGDRPAALDAVRKIRNLGWDPAADAYGAAWTLAWCVPIVEKDDNLDAPKQQAEMQFYADQATAMLRDAVAKGYKDVEHLKKNKDLDVLREREDFKKLVAELEAAKQAPSKKP
jgi:serine/threonine protein kinase